MNGTTLTASVLTVLTAFPAFVRDTQAGPIVMDQKRVITSPMAPGALSSVGRRPGSPGQPEPTQRFTGGLLGTLLRIEVQTGNSDVLGEPLPHHLAIDLGSSKNGHALLDSFTIISPPERITGGLWNGTPADFTQGRQFRPLGASASEIGMSDPQPDTVRYSPRAEATSSGIPESSGFVFLGLVAALLAGCSRRRRVRHVILPPANSDGQLASSAEQLAANFRGTLNLRPGRRPARWGYGAGRKSPCQPVQAERPGGRSQTHSSPACVNRADTVRSLDPPHESV